SDDGKIGLQEYLQWDGLAFKLVPKRASQTSWSNMDHRRMEQHLMTDRQGPAKTPEFGFLWRNLRDSTVYFDEDARRMMVNYRQTFLALSGYYLNVANQPQKVVAALDRMEEVVPRRVITMPHRLKLVVANYYDFAGEKERFRQLCQEIVDDIKPVVERGTTEDLSIEHPYLVLLQTYALLEQYDDALQLLTTIKQSYPLVPGIDQFVSERKNELEARRAVVMQWKDTVLSAPQKTTGNK
ncbi:MAG: hypothetical protein ACRDGA_01430, partial [Bacteroidota bacterium]